MAEPEFGTFVEEVIKRSPKSDEIRCLSLEPADGGDAFSVLTAGEALAGRILELRPSVVLTGATPYGKAAAAWAAARVKAGLTADLFDFYMDGAGVLHQFRSAYGGSLTAEIVCVNDGIQMATVRPSLYAFPRKETENRKKRSGWGLAGADIVVAGGLGLGRDGFQVLKRLAELLGGAVGATRAAVDAGLAPFEAQIGQSGHFVRPKLYLAFGISGAVQHLAGMKESKTIVAINSNPKAPIFEYADFGVTGDGAETAEKMIKLLEAESCD